MHLPEVVVIVCIVLLGGFVLTSAMFNQSSQIAVETAIPTATLDPQILPYEAPQLPKQESYRIILIGDSMTERLGLNANMLRLSLKERYPETEFVTYNYSVPSSNILSVPDRLTESGTYLGQSLPPILNQGYDLLILESFAYNPLSELEIETGLKKQEDILESVINKLVKNKPESPILIMNTIAPDRETFASYELDLSQQQRDQWVDERIAYLKNAIDFAEKNNIPAVNIYEKSLDENGKAVEKYIDSDTVHPSEAGIEFISNEIADFIYENNILPH